MKTGISMKAFLQLQYLRGDLSARGLRFLAPFYAACEEADRLLPNTPVTAYDRPLRGHSASRRRASR